MLRQLLCSQQLFLENSTSKETAEETIGRKLNLKDDVIRRALDPVEFVKTRVTSGSCSPSEVKRMIVGAERRLANEENWLSNERAKLKRSSEKLDKAVQDILYG